MTRTSFPSTRRWPGKSLLVLKQNWGNSRLIQHFTCNTHEVQHKQLGFLRVGKRVFVFMLSNSGCSLKFKSIIRHEAKLVTKTPQRARNVDLIYWLLSLFLIK
jgi:hypothetical protein